MLKVLADCEWWEMLRNALCLKQLPLKCPSLVPPSKCHLARFAGKAEEKVYLGGIGIFYQLSKKYEPLFCFLSYFFFLW